MLYRCEVLSPLHIGTGQTLVPLEYLADGFFAVVNQPALFTAAPEEAKRLVDRLSRLTPDEIQRQTLGQFVPAGLQGRLGLLRYRCQLSPYVKGQLDRARERGQAEVRVAIKTPADRPYLPGTSLKGGLRTALAYAWIKEDGGAFSALKEAPIRDKWRAVEAMLRAGGPNDVTRDVFRALEVGDSQPKDPEGCLLVAHEAVLSAAVRRGSNRVGDAPGAWKAFPTFLEAVKPGTLLEGRIGFRERLLREPFGSRLGWHLRHRNLSLGEFLAASNLLAADVIAWEHRYLTRVTGLQVDAIRRFYQQLSERVRTAPGNEAYLCLGRGAGWHKSTVGLLLEQAHDFDFPDFRRKGGTAERRGTGFDRTNFDFPKTRKFVMDVAEKPLAPLGWVRLVLPDLPARHHGRPTERQEAPPATPVTLQREGPWPEAVAPEPKGSGRASPGEKADLEALRQRFGKPKAGRPDSERGSKAGEKAKREQEKIARRYRGEEE